MVRAELGAGNRGAAIELLERLRERYVFLLFLYSLLPALNLNIE